MLIAANTVSSLMDNKLPEMVLRQKTDLKVKKYVVTPEGYFWGGKM